MRAFGSFLLVQSALALGALAQQTSTLLVIGLGAPNNLSGQAVGTGAEGTTYILEGVDPLQSTTIPFTMTLVQASNSLFETVAIPGDEDFGALAACTLSGSGPSGAAICAEIVQVATQTITQITTRSFADIAQAIPVSDGTPPSDFTTGPITLPPLTGISTLTSPTGSQITITSLPGQSSSTPRTTAATTTSTTTSSGSSLRSRSGSVFLMGVAVVFGVILGVY